MVENKEEIEEMPEESSFPEIAKENEQMDEKSFSEDEKNLTWNSMKKEIDFNSNEKIPSWISAKDEIDFNGTDIVDQVLLRIKRKYDKYRYLFMFPIMENDIHVNIASMDSRKPILVSIGPNHRDTIKPDVMERHKLKYLEEFFTRTGTNVEKILRADHEAFLLECDLYNNDRGDPHHVLMETWILDGCFIIELFRRNDDRESILLFTERVLYALSRDLILPDNQIPRTILNPLIECSLSGKSKQFAELAQKFLERIVPNQKLYHVPWNIDFECGDLRAIVYDGLKWSSSNKANNNVEVGDDKWKMVKSATELQEFGVEFNIIEIDNFVEIKFGNQVLEMAPIHIGYGTPYCIQILLEYEQSDTPEKDLNNYLWFMNSLVKSPNDVQLLRQKGIINNLSELPDDAAIHKFLKDFYGSLMISPANFNYIQVCRDLNSHCSHRRNSWMAKLKRDYFNSPWAVISLFGASLLLILTVVQTVFSVASYYNQG